MINSLFYFPKNHLCTRQRNGPWSWGWTKQDDCPHPVHSLLFTFCSVTQSCPTPLTVACQCPSTFPRACLKLMSIESVMPSNFLVLCHPLFILPSIFPSIKVFSNELALCIKWPKHCNFSISKYSGLISFRIAGWISLQSKGLSKSLLQHHNSKAWILQHSLLYGPTLTSIHDYWKKNI